MAVFYKWVKGCGSSATIGSELGLKDSKDYTNDAWTILKWTDQLWYTKDGSGADFMYAENNPQVYYNNANGLAGLAPQYSTGRVLTSSARGQECYYDLNFKSYSNSMVSTFQQNSDAFRLTTNIFIVKDANGGNEIFGVYGLNYNPCIYTHPSWDVKLNGPVYMENDAKISGSLTVGKSDITSLSGFWCNSTENTPVKLWGQSVEVITDAKLGLFGDTSSLFVPKYNGSSTSNIEANTSLWVKTGYVKAPYFNATSDRRAKENIKKAEFSGIDTVKQLNVYNFNYKNSTQPSIGVIAQEALDIKIGDFSLVENQQASGENEDYMSIKESKLIYVLMKAVQEQQEQIEKLQAEIKQLKA